MHPQRVFRTKSEQLFYRYVLAVEANERQDVQQRLWDEFILQVIVENPPKQTTMRVPG